MQNKLNKEIFFEKTKINIKKKLQKVDQKIINISLIIDKLPKNINELYEQLRIITDLRLPTLDQYTNIKQYCQICLFDIDNKLNIDNLEILESLNINKENKKEIKQIIQENIGFELDNDNKDIILDMSKNILNLIEFKEKLEKILEKLFLENYINFYKLTDIKIACKMLEIAGSFERLASMPASTIQLIGSEKSFFKALKMNTKTPKYGILYNHPLIQNLSKKNKGRFARTLASKISIALKSDLNKSETYNELLIKLNKKLEQLK
jgi:RNA processing factor Prp31